MSRRGGIPLSLHKMIMEEETGAHGKARRRQRARARRSRVKRFRAGLEPHEMGVMRVEAKVGEGEEGGGLDLEKEEETVRECRQGETSESEDGGSRETQHQQRQRRRWWWERLRSTMRRKRKGRSEERVERGVRRLSRLRPRQHSGLKCRRRKQCSWLWRLKPNSRCRRRGWRDEEEKQQKKKKARTTMTGARGGREARHGAGEEPKGKQKQVEKIGRCLRERWRGRVSLRSWMCSWALERWEMKQQAKIAWPVMRSSVIMSCVGDVNAEDRCVKTAMSAIYACAVMASKWCWLVWVWVGVRMVLRQARNLRGSDGQTVRNKCRRLRRKLFRRGRRWLKWLWRARDRVTRGGEWMERRLQKCAWWRHVQQRKAKWKEAHGLRGIGKARSRGRGLRASWMKRGRRPREEGGSLTLRMASGRRSKGRDAERPRRRWRTETRASERGSDRIAVEWRELLEEGENWRFATARKGRGHGTEQEKERDVVAAKKGREKRNRDSEKGNERAQGDNGEAIMGWSERARSGSDRAGSKKQEKKGWQQTIELRDAGSMRGSRMWGIKKTEYGGRRLVGAMLAIMVGSGGILLGWRGVRVGEADTPGPYSEGGATASGTGRSGKAWVEIGHGRWTNAERMEGRGAARAGEGSGDGVEGRSGEARRRADAMEVIVGAEQPRQDSVDGRQRSRSPGRGERVACRGEGVVRGVATGDASGGIRIGGEALFQQLQAMTKKEADARYARWSRARAPAGEDDDRSGERQNSDEAGGADGWMSSGNGGGAGEGWWDTEYVEDQECWAMLNAIDDTAMWTDITPEEHAKMWRVVEDMGKEGAGRADEAGSPRCEEAAHRSGAWEKHEGGEGGGEAHSGEGQVDEAFLELDAWLNDCERMPEDLGIEEEWHRIQQEAEAQAMLDWEQGGGEGVADVARTLGTTFVPAKRFEGYMAGMVFKKGAQGVGYYTDNPGQAEEANGHGRGIQICLDRLIDRGEEAEGIESSGRRGARNGGRARSGRRKRQRRRGGREKWREMEARVGKQQAVQGHDGRQEASSATWATEQEVGDGSSCTEVSSGDEGEGKEERSDTTWGTMSSEEEEATSGEEGEAEMEEKDWASEIGEEEVQEAFGQSRGWWLFDTVNANAWGADDSAGKGRGALDFLHRTSADVVGIQETRMATCEKCAAGMVAARKAKWKTKLEQADITRKGYTSAGVAVACRSHFGASYPQMEGVNVDKARIAHAHVGAVCRGGIHCFALYLVTCEGMSERNRSLLLDLARLIKAVRGPWVVMGDFNMPPEALEQAGGGR